MNPAFEYLGRAPLSAGEARRYYYSMVDNMLFTRLCLIKGNDADDRAFAISQGENSDLRSGSWRVRVYPNPIELERACASMAELDLRQDQLGAFVVGPSKRLIDANNKSVPSLFVNARSFARDELVTQYNGRLLDRDSPIARKSEHAIAAFGRPGKVIVGVTSTSRREIGGAASLINDAAIDVAASLRESRGARRPIVVHNARNYHNVEFIALVVEEEYDRWTSGEIDELEHVCIAVVALVSLTEGDELSVDYSDAYWREYLARRL